MAALEEWTMTPAKASLIAAREERDAQRRAAHDQRMAYRATKKGRAAAERAAKKAAAAHRARLDAYAHGARGPQAHHHLSGARTRRAKKAEQRSRRAHRELIHRGDPSTWRKRRADAIATEAAA